MSGGVALTTVGRDEIVTILKERISYLKVGEGGFYLSGETIEVIDPGAVGGNSDVDYTISGGDFPLTGVNQGTKTFTISGEYASYFPEGTRLRIVESTANNGLYTVAAGGASEGGGETDITVDESIPSATVDGNLLVDHLPIAKGPTQDAKHWPLVVEERTPGLALVQSVSDTTGTGSLTGNGTGTINYKTGVLHVDFNLNITPGNIIRAVFKYHDTRKDPTVGQGYEDIESSQRYSIIGVNQGTKTFRLDGLHAGLMVNTPKVKVEGSTNIDGLYTPVSITEATGDTYVQVSEAIPGTTADGLLGPVSLDGEPELATFTKQFGADVDTVITFRGVGWGTIRCNIKLQLWEGIDDGRGSTYGGIPYYFEGGIFDDNDVLLAYFTFDKQRKTGSVEIEHTVDFVV